MAAPQIRMFNWADSDSDADDVSSPEQTTTGLLAATLATPPQKAAPAVVPASTRTCAGGLSEDDEQSRTQSAAESPALGAARELDFGGSGGCAGVSPFRQCQEVTIQAAIPYTLKSVWSPAPAGAVSVAPAVAALPPAASTPAAVSAPSAAAFTTPSKALAYATAPSSAAATPAPASATTNSPALVAAAPATAAVAPLRPLRMNRALDELTSVLRQHNGSLPYDELMLKAQWRSRFQPSFGSLFTFLKRNRDIFHYQQSVVRLLQEASIVAELLKINWAGAATAAAAASSAVAQPSAAGTSKQ